MTSELLELTKGVNYSTNGNSDANNIMKSELLQSTKGVKYSSKDITKTQQQRPESLNYGSSKSPGMRVDTAHGHNHLQPKVHRPQIEALDFPSCCVFGSISNINAYIYFVV